MCNLKVIPGILLIMFPISVSAQTSQNLLVNGDFSGSDAGWNFSVITPAQATGSVVNGEYNVTITNGSTESWYIQLMQSGLPVGNGKTYMVSFEAYTASPRDISVAFIKDWTGAWTGYHYQTFAITTSKRKYKFEFNVDDPTAENAKFYFDFGNSSEDVYVDNVTVYEKEITGTLVNGDFTGGDDYWTTNIHSDAAAYGSVQNEAYLMSVSDGGTQAYHIQLMQSDLWIEQGKSYTITFDAYAEKSREINVVVQHQADPWTTYKFKNVNLTTQRQTYSTSFTMSESTDLKVRLVFEFGLSDADVCLDNISINTEAPLAPFKHGVNFADWLENFRNISQMNFNRYTKKNFEEAKSLGCDHIRVPIDMFDMTGPAPDYLLDPLLYRILDQAIDWAEQLDLHLILDNHSFDFEITLDYLDQLKAVWVQLANRYKNRSNLIHYEIINEPHGISDALWNDMQQQVIETIRAIDDKHTIIVAPANWDSFLNLQFMSAYEDTNLIYTFHFYDPALFTGQGCYWDHPDRTNLRDIPYPYNADLMPDLLPEFNGTWVETVYNYYPHEGNDAWIQSRIDNAIQFMNERHVSVWCGEFGCYKPNCGQEDRARWLNTVRSYFESNHISWTMWEYGDGFGIFENSRELFEYDVNTPIIEALSLTVPPQSEYQFVPDTSGFVLYDDFLPQHIFHSSWYTGGDANFCSGDDPKEGEFCISWSESDKNSMLGLRFTPVHDLTQLRAENYMLRLWVRCSKSDAKFDFRFLDTNTDDPNDHPWRMYYTIDNTKINWDGTWQQIQIPLKYFTEQGAWEDGSWYTPQGKFDWSQVERFEIGADHHDLHNIKLYLDDIRIIEPVTDVQKQYSGTAFQFALDQNYPNPFSSATIISYSLPQPGYVKLEVFNMLGQKVSTLIDVKQEAGTHNVEWRITNDNKDKISSGIYFYSIKVVCANHIYQAMKQMILMK